MTDKPFYARNGLVANGSVVVNSTAVTLGSVPISANGTYGTSGQVLTSNGSADYWGNTAATPPSGSNTYVQFNDSGAFGSDSSLTFNKATGTLSVSALSAALSINVGAVLFVNATTIVLGTKSLSANGTTGTSGQVLLSNGTATYWGTGPAPAAAGSNTQVLFNDSGVTTGSVDLVFNKLTGTLTANNLVGTNLANVAGLNASGNAAVLGALTANNLVVTGTIDNQANTKSQTLVDGATVTWNCAAGAIATLTIGGNRALATPTNMRVGTYVLHLYQDGTGSRTLTPNTSTYKFSGNVTPVATANAGAHDIYTFICDGSKMYGSFLPDVGT